MRRGRVRLGCDWGGACAALRDAPRGAGPRLDGLDRVLDLEQTALRAEGIDASAIGEMDGVINENRESHGRSIALLCAPVIVAVREEHNGSSLYVWDVMGYLSCLSS